MADFPLVPERMAPVNAQVQNCFVHGRGYIFKQAYAKNKKATKLIIKEDFYHVKRENY
jgi:hypothetical protein